MSFKAVSNPDEVNEKVENVNWVYLKSKREKLE
jgi:hypothetical protein